MNQKQFSAMYERLEKTHADSGAFPWAAIIQAVLAMLGGCITPPANGTELKALDAKTPQNERWLRFCCAQSLRESGVRATKANVDKAVAAVLAAREEASVAELDDILGDAFVWGA